MVYGGGWEHCTPDYRIDRVDFPFTVLEFVAAGAGELVMNRKLYDLRPGTVFVYGRRMPHSMANRTEHDVTKYFVALGGRGLAAVLRGRGLTPGTVAHVSQPDRIRQIFDDLIDFGLGDGTARDRACAQTAQYLLLKTADLLIPAYRSAARAFATYERCREYMEARALEIRTLDEVSSACHVDKAYLCRLFKRFGREQPFQYLQHLRMNHAMTQLQTSDRMIKDIAFDLGFSDAANFTRAFGRWFGVPPQAMRGG